MTNINFQPPPAPPRHISPDATGTPPPAPPRFAPDDIWQDGLPGEDAKWSQFVNRPTDENDSLMAKIRRHPKVAAAVTAVALLGSVGAAKEIMLAEGQPVAAVEAAIRQFRSSHRSQRKGPPTLCKQESYLMSLYDQEK